MATEEPAKILKLPDHVINLIAAGEVIQRPWNAVKELIENSLDAGATEIRITVKDGGLKYLQIQDNGTGIASSDLELLCQRYTTSKLREFGDLQSILTYGFRGEALASISQISHLSLVTRTSSTLHGFRAEYEGGQLKEKPKLCACNRGTQITAEDMFYNMPERRKALKVPGEEMKKMANVVGRYAIHNSSVSFTLKKHGEAVMELRTSGLVGNKDPNSCPTRTAIGVVYGSILARDLLRFQCDDAPPELAFKAEGYVSGPGQATKQFTFILFINNRLVECNVLRKSLESLYTTYGPAKMVAPFVYLKMEVEPSRIDVNVHPSKELVQFLHEREIIAALESSLKKTLDESIASKSFIVKTLPVMRADKDQQQEGAEKRGQEGKNGNQKKIEPHSMVRTDGKERRLDEFFGAQPAPASQTIRVNFIDFDGEQAKESNEPGTSGQNVGEGNGGTAGKSDGETARAKITDEDISILYETGARDPTQRPIRLASVLSLQKRIKERCSPKMRELIADNTFVGCVDPEYCLVQHGTGLYLLNTTALSEEYFYQVTLFQFSNYGTLTLSERCRLIDLIAMELPPRTIDKRQKAMEYATFLMSKANVMWDYFSLKLTDGYLVSIPWLLEKYTPQLEGLSSYVYRLATAVDWRDEEDCFETFCRETAKFYSFKKKYCRGDKAAHFSNSAQLDWKAMMETVLYPALKSKLLPPATVVDSCAIVSVTDVRDLYKIFERC